MTTAFVLSGGAALGAVQVGMLQALHGEGIRPDIIVGTSAGAINGSWIAGDGGYDDLENLANIWRGLSRKSVFPTSWWQLFKGATGRSDHLVKPAALRALVGDSLGFNRLEDAAIPFHVVAADALEGRDHRFSSGPALEAVVASASIPGVLPAVVIEGVAYVDGGTLNNTPVSHAVALGAGTSVGHSEWLPMWRFRNARICPRNGTSRDLVDGEPASCPRHREVSPRRRLASHPTPVPAGCQCDGLRPGRLAHHNCARGRRHLAPNSRSQRGRRQCRRTSRPDQRRPRRCHPRPRPGNAKLGPLLVDGRPCPTTAPRLHPPDLWRTAPTG